MTKYRTTTGGNIDFGDPGKLDDTESSKEFKKAYLLHHFYKNPYDTENIEKLKEHVPFYKLNIGLEKREKPTSFSLEIIHKNKAFLKIENIKGEKAIELPKGKYAIKIITKTFLFFKKTKLMHINLSENKKHSVHY